LQSYVYAIAIAIDAKSKANPYALND